MLGELEQVVLLGVLRVGKDAYGVPVHDEIQRRSRARPDARDDLQNAHAPRGQRTRRLVHRRADRRARRTTHAVLHGDRAPGSARSRRRSKRSATWPPDSTSDWNRHDSRLRSGCSSDRCGPKSARASSAISSNSNSAARSGFWAKPSSALWNLHARPQTGDGLVMTFIGDLRIAARLLRRAPAFTVVSRAHARLGDRRDDGDLQRDRARAAAAAALPTARAPRVRLGARARRQPRQRRLRDVPRLHERVEDDRVRRGDRRLATDALRRRQSRARLRRPRLVAVLPHARRASGDRPRLPRRGRRARAKTRSSSSATRCGSDATAPTHRSSDDRSRSATIR